MNNSRGNTVLVGLLSALLIPRIQKATGVVLTNEDMFALFGLALALWHAGVATLDKYFPPPKG